jgi:major membrane immunogen (membrane-anchored lipoprotein)
MLKKTLLSLIVLVMLLSACGGSSMSAPQAMPVDDGFFYEEQAAGNAAPEYYEEEGARDSSAINVEASPIERMVIKNAELAIITVDPAASMDEIGKMAESMGGFVVSSNLYQRTLSNGAKVPQANITVRVPVERLDEALEQIKAGAVEVENENTSGQDVTQEYTDLQSQLRNLEAAEAQLMEIMEGATKTEDVLSIYNELVYKREQIEIIKGRMQYYEQAAALSKIDVGITADEAVQPIQVGGWQPSGVAKEAIEALIQTLQFLVNAGIWLVLCVLPVGLLIGLPLFLVGRFVIQGRKRRKAAKQLEAALPEEE